MTGGLQATFDWVRDQWPDDWRVQAVAAGTLVLLIFVLLIRRRSSRAEPVIAGDATHQPISPDDTPGSDDPAQPRDNTFLEVLWALGALSSAPALISLLQHWFSIGLAPSLADFVTFYRNLIHPIFDILYAPLRPLLKLFGVLTVPQWFVDLQTVSILATWLSIRTSFVSEAQAWRQRGNLWFWVWTRSLIALSIVGAVPSIISLVMGMIIAAIPTPLFDIFGRILGSEGADDLRSVARRGRSAWTLIVATIAFYASNAIMLFGV